MFEHIVESTGLRELIDQVGYAERWQAADILADQINANLADLNVCAYNDNFENNETPPNTTAELFANGSVELGVLLDSDKISDIISYFEDCCCYNSHIYRYSDKQCYDLDAVSQHPFGSYQLVDVLRAPHLLELANHPKVIETVAGYLGCTPSFYSLNAWWSFGDNADAENVTQGFHRDMDDFRFCSLFVYLTDVEENEGDHQYYRRTHRPELVREMLAGTSFPNVDIVTETGRKTVHFDFDHLFNNFGYGGDAIYEALFDKHLSKISGRAGTAFITDPFGLHRGNPSLHGRRLAFWARYGLFDNNAYHGDVERPVNLHTENHRLPDNLRSAYINRLIIAPDKTR